MKSFNIEKINLPLMVLIVGFVFALPLVIRVHNMDLRDDIILYSLAVTRFFLTVFSIVVYTVVFGFLGLIGISLFIYGLNLWAQEHSYFASVVTLIAAFSVLYSLLGLTYFPDLMSSGVGTYNDDVVYPYYPLN